MDFCCGGGRRGKKSKAPRRRGNTRYENLTREEPMVSAMGKVERGSLVLNYQYYALIRREKYSRRRERRRQRRQTKRREAKDATTISRADDTLNKAESKGLEIEEKTKSMPTLDSVDLYREDEPYSSFEYTKAEEAFDVMIPPPGITVTDRSGENRVTLGATTLSISEDVDEESESSVSKRDSELPVAVPHPNSMLWEKPSIVELEREQFKARLTRFYEKYDPSHLDDNFDAFVDENIHDQEGLFATLVRRYGSEPSLSLSPPPPLTTAPPAPSGHSPRAPPSSPPSLDVRPTPPPTPPVPIFKGMETSVEASIPGMLSQADVSSSSLVGMLDKREGSPIVPFSDIISPTDTGTKVAEDHFPKPTTHSSVAVPPPHHETATKANLADDIPLASTTQSTASPAVAVVVGAPKNASTKAADDLSAHSTTKEAASSALNVSSGDPGRFPRDHEMWTVAADLFRHGESYDSVHSKIQEKWHRGVEHPDDKTRLKALSIAKGIVDADGNPVPPRPLRPRRKRKGSKRRGSRKDEAPTTPSPPPPPPPPPPVSLSAAPPENVSSASISSIVGTVSTGSGLASSGVSSPAVHTIAPAARFHHSHTAPPKRPDDGDRFKARVRRFYKKYNPSKLDGTFDAFVEKYRSHEQDLFKNLVRKYGPEPRAPLGA